MDFMFEEVRKVDSVIRIKDQCNCNSNIEERVRRRRRRLSPPLYHPSEHLHLSSLKYLSACTSTEQLHLARYPTFQHLTFPCSMYEILAYTLRTDTFESFYIVHYT